MLEGENVVLYVLDKLRVDYYISLIQSNDSRTKIVGMQQLLFDLEAGFLLTPYDKKRIELIISSVIVSNKDSRVRQWCYMVCSFFVSDIISRICRDNFEKENSKNQSWILALLSANLNKDEFKKIRKTAENYLSIDVINLATYLFSTYSTIRVDNKYAETIIRKNNDKLAILWLGWIAAFKNQDMRRNKHTLLYQKQLIELTSSTDDDVLKHIMAAMCTQKGFSVNDVLFDVYDYTHMGSEHKKWTMTAFFNDKGFIGDKKDFILELFSKEHLFKICDKREREGLARGLSTYKYDSDFAYSILEWFSNETETSVKQYLLEYLIKNQKHNDDFVQMIISDSLYGNKVDKLKIKLNSNPKSPYDIKLECYDNYPIKVQIGKIEINSLIDYSEEKIMEKAFVNFSVNGDGNVVGDNNNSTNCSGNTIYSNNSVSIEKLLEEIEKAKIEIPLFESLNSEQKQVLLDILDETKEAHRENSDEKKDKVKKDFNRIKSFLIKTAPNVIAFLANLSQIALFLGLNSNLF